MEGAIFPIPIDQVLDEESEKEKMVFELLSFGRVMLQYNFREHRCHNSKNSQWGVLLRLPTRFFFFWRVLSNAEFTLGGYLRNSKQIIYIKLLEVIRTADLSPRILGLSEPSKEREMPPYSWRIVAHIMCIWEYYIPPVIKRVVAKW